MAAADALHGRDRPLMYETNARGLDGRQPVLSRCRLQGRGDN